MNASLILIFLALCACMPGVKASVDRTQPVSVTEVKIDAAIANARVTSPLEVTGVAPCACYFEAVFAARLEGINRTV